MNLLKIGFAAFALVAGCATPTFARPANVASSTDYENLVSPDDIDEPVGSVRYISLPDGGIAAVPAGVSDQEALRKLGYPPPSSPTQLSKSALAGRVVAAQLLAGLPFAIWAWFRRREGRASKARKFGFYGFTLPAWQCLALLLTAYFLPQTSDQSINSAVGFGGWAMILGLVGFAIGKWQDRKAAVSGPLPPSAPATAVADPNAVASKELTLGVVEMSDAVKIALVAGVVVLLAVGAVLYYSPYQQCVRAKIAQRQDWKVLAGIPNTPSDVEHSAKIWCARNT